jgi:hypothetical protein
MVVIPGDPGPEPGETRDPVNSKRRMMLSIDDSVYWIPALAALGRDDERGNA